MNSNSPPSISKVIRGLEALNSLTKLNDPPSGLSVISRKYKSASVIERNGGQCAIYEFANGYGASVINSGMSYGGLELAVLDSAGNLTYDTPVTEDVEGNLDADRLDALLAQIEALPRAEAAT